MSFLNPQASKTAIADAQAEMRFAYYGGAPGIYASATAWFVAAFVAMQYAASNAVWALFIGALTGAINETVFAPPIFMMAKAEHASSSRL